ncbi:MAG: NYN domain-containing protein [Betaproteobacteria bacterium]
MLSCVKLRLGVLNNVGEQKGVDSLIVTDLIELARNRAIADAVIVSGDEDLRVAVQVAQSCGVRVHVLAAGDPKGNVSAALQMEADSVGSMPDSWFKENLLIASPAPVVSVGSLVSKSTATMAVPESVTLEDAAGKASQELLATATRVQIEALKEHFQRSNSVPPEFDRRLIAKTAAGLGGRQLSGDEMRHTRGVFVKAVRVL